MELKKQEKKESYIQKMAAEKVNQLTQTHSLLVCTREGLERDTKQLLQALRQLSNALNQYQMIVLNQEENLRAPYLRDEHSAEDQPTNAPAATHVERIV